MGMQHCRACSLIRGGWVMHQSSGGSAGPGSVAHLGRVGGGGGGGISGVAELGEEQRAVGGALGEGGWCLTGGQLQKWKCRYN